MTLTVSDWLTEWNKTLEFTDYENRRVLKYIFLWLLQSNLFMIFLNAASGLMNNLLIKA